MIKLILFDLDGTLVEYKGTELYPDSLQWLIEHGVEYSLGIVTNQGGVGLRYWQETHHFGKPEELPTADDVRKHLIAILKQFPPQIRGFIEVFVCYAYQAKSNQKWSPTPENRGVEDGWDRDWRKPAPGMLLAAMRKAQVAPEDTLMVGDAAEDEQAARAAGCAFQWAWQFFGRPEPEDSAEG